MTKTPGAVYYTRYYSFFYLVNCAFGMLHTNCGYYWFLGVSQQLHLAFVTLTLDRYKKHQVGHLAFGTLCLLIFSAHFGLLISTVATKARHSIFVDGVKDVSSALV